MPRGGFEFKYTVADGNGYPKNGLIRSSAKNGITTLFYFRRLTDKEIAKFDMTEHSKRYGRLTTLREQAGKRQKDMAEELHIAPKSLQRYEQYGAEQMTLGTAIKVADYLGVDVRDLVDTTKADAEQSEQSE